MLVFTRSKYTRQSLGATVKILFKFVSKSITAYLQKLHATHIHVMCNVSSTYLQHNLLPELKLLRLNNKCCRDCDIQKGTNTKAFVDYPLALLYCDICAPVVNTTHTQQNIIYQLQTLHIKIKYCVYSEMLGYVNIAE